jgi:dihydropteroate synthase
MGILNVTPDSFSDGGRYYNLDLAVEHALAMEADGADIIDIGGESTRPGAPPVGVDEELERVLPVIERLAKVVKIPISIDTYKAEVARMAILAGAEIVNDISAMTFDPQMASMVADTGAGVVLMHSRGRPSDMQKDTQYNSLVAEIIAFLHTAMKNGEKAGISRQKMVIDPGIGFGKSVTGNLEILRHLQEFCLLERPIMIGVSRKSFIGKVLGREPEERLFGTAAAVALSLAHGAMIFRVHDVRAMRDAADMASAICWYSNMDYDQLKG